jgi:large subunit ribosomal protein L18
MAEKTTKKEISIDKNTRYRVIVFRSNKEIYAQIIDKSSGNIIVSFSSLALKDKKSPQEKAKIVGQKLAALALEKKIEKIVFDRGSYKYHGRVKALAEGLREGKLAF